ncbi:hypothetical protein DDQ45_17955 [Salmonella enterica]|nr:hypothetical protein [Salmonella enterica]EDR7524785.1 hypothetical protein [Salmonella enterica subsp. enterica serovar Oranienburg]EIM5532828.1 hypothetical protein [Salmonella enterica subsp. enterica]
MADGKERGIFVKKSGDIRHKLSGLFSAFQQEESYNSGHINHLRNMSLVIILFCGVATGVHARNFGTPAQRAQQSWNLDVNEPAFSPVITITPETNVAAGVPSGTRLAKVVVTGLEKITTTENGIAICWNTGDGGYIKNADGQTTAISIVASGSGRKLDVGSLGTEQNIADDLATGVDYFESFSGCSLDTTVYINSAGLLLPGRYTNVLEAMFYWR